MPPRSIFFSLQLRINDQNTHLISAHSENQEDEEEELDLDSVSDAEALLACRSFLQKTNQLREWRQRPTPRDDMFFWENPSALRYFQPPRTNTFRQNVTKTTEDSARNQTWQSIQGTRYVVQWDTADATDASPEVASWPNDLPSDEENVVDQSMDGDAVVAEVSMLTVPSSSHVDAPADHAVWNSVWDLDEDPSEDSTATTVLSSTLSLNKLYSPYDDETNELLQHQRRSQASRQRFQNATWKAEWYHRRWGGRDRRTLSPADRRARRIPAAFLAQLATWEEDQLAAAMQQYRGANQRRARRRRRTNARRRQFLSAIPGSSAPSTTARFHYHDEDDDTAAVPRPKVLASFLVPEAPQANPILQAERERRAAQAQRAYQQRVPQASLQPLLVPKNTKVRRALSESPRTPLEALRATEELLQSHSRLGLYKNSELLSQLQTLITIFLPPTKLSHRKEILCRILSHVFDLRGKCIPVLGKSGDATASHQFVTKASLQVLGSFVMERIEQRLQELAANQSDPVV